MKRLVGSLLFASMLIVGSGQAQATALEDWTYTLNSIGFRDTYSPTLYNNFDFNSREYSNEMNIEFPNTPTGTMFLDSSKLINPGDSVSDAIVEDNVLNHTVSLLTDINDGYTPNNQVNELTNLVFSYSVASTDPNKRFNITYTIPLLSYADGKGNEYIFYDIDAVNTMGSTALTDDTYKYGITGIGLFVDGRSLTGVASSPNYVGWTINEDTRAYTFDNYVVSAGTKNFYGTYLNEVYYKNAAGEFVNADGDIVDESLLSDKSYLAKTNPDYFDITGAFSLTATLVDPNTPTPEPATMLLMGAGLAGLGFVKRRRQA